VEPRTLEGRVFLAGVYHGVPADRAGLLVGDEIVATDGAPFDPIGSFADKQQRSTMTAPDPDELPYRYESRGRTPLNLGLFAIGIGMLALALATTDTTLVFLPLTAFAAMMGYLVILDPRAGLDIDARAVSFWRGHKRETIAVAEIERVHVEHWSDSVDVTIHRHDGVMVDVPARCRPALRSLTRALKRAGVVVTER
jgi:hypothetical protein